ncbi:helix-turn-helix domain-containing protein [Vaginisenegalia massiliensis]|uniref:helix-turn-helix domain-containing protein n=1 Tax=Vaginisenegalia massiliensis TaxID=2058294 RepID=UPI000F51D716|nr:helix-turn-helix domain-containing protein [Vaginisenegalia massiliensis]
MTSELGTKLRNARVEKGYTLNTLQQMTKIQKKYLMAIEEGQYNEMPGTFYVRAFVKQYADMVGLNGDELLEEYKEELLVSQQDVEAELDIPDDELPSRLSQRRNSSNDQSTLEMLMAYLPLIGLIAIIVMIILALILAINKIGTIEENPTPVNNTDSTVVTTLTPDGKPKNKAKDAEGSDATADLGPNDIKVGSKKLTNVSVEGGETIYQVNPSFDGYEFEVKGLGTDWVGYSENDVMLKDQVLKEGESLKYTATPQANSVLIQFGYPQGVEVYVNGTKIEFENTVYPNSIRFVLPGQNQAETPISETTTIQESNAIMDQSSVSQEATSSY